ncbi:Streptogramin A acetyltransferase [Poriferisphaera corsica]|uniref:Streptogramin A acetyltransferase n=1 Tax=Poriferisphaera corsica TaxID=2528020 RepID=A0A517YZ19_9BACT|nr:CatB-related O-acetyltransferase [Poriferisphaera corsica]QDU35474.1 Streptogramin A acetyltransferase [Poriferisphaera corsica]
MTLLDSTKKHPMVMPDGMVVEDIVYLKQVIDHPRLEVGEFSYMHTFERDVTDYCRLLLPYLFPMSCEKVVIGKFVQIAHGVKIVTQSANHKMDGISTYPFMNFMMTEETTAEDIDAMFARGVDRGDTVIGHDVWLGMDAVVMPGVKIGDGAIIGTRSLVVKDIEPYTIVGGNPAKVIRKRFSDEVIEVLGEVKWWDWPIEKIEANVEVIRGGDVEALKKLSGM